MSLEETLAEVEAQVIKLPDNSHVRVKASADNPILTNMEALIRMFPMLVWSKKVDEIEAEVVDIVEDLTEYTPITLTRDNLEGLLLERLIQAGSESATVEAARDILKEVMV